MRSGSPVLFLVLAMAACDRDPQNTTPTTSTSTSTASSAPTPSGPSACEMIKALWIPDGFIGVSTAGSASASALNAQMNDAVQTMRIRYTGDQIKVKSGSQIMMSSYSVMKDSPKVCTLKNGNDTVVITFSDPDHALVDRTTNPYAAKMKMHKTDDDAGI